MRCARPWLGSCRAMVSRDGRERAALGAGRLVLVSCRRCRMPIITVARIGHEELDALLAHVRSCQPSAILPDPPGVETVLRHFHVQAVPRETASRPRPTGRRGSAISAARYAACASSWTSRRTSSRVWRA